MIYTELYVGDPGAAWARLRRVWPSLRAAQFLRIAYISAELWYLRGKVGLALLAARGSGVPKDLLRRSVQESIARIAGGDLAVHAPFAAVLRGGLARHFGEPCKTRMALERAVAGFERAEMPLHREAVRMRLAAFIGDEASHARASRWLAEAGVRNPARMVDVLAP